MPLIDIGSGVKYEASTTGSGTGNYDAFVRIQANGDEEGFNTDDGNEADNKDGIWTHSLLVSGLQAIDVGGTLYYEIRLDLNEVQSGTQPNITLEDLRIFRSAAPADGDDFDDDFASLTEVFDLGAALDLVDTNHGSGTDDYVFLVPVSLFPVGTEYLTLYADFSGSSDGFEEFRVRSQEFAPQPDIGVLKETNGTDDVCPTILTGETVTWTYTVDNNGNLALSNVVVTDDNGTPLDNTDDFNPDAVLGADLVHNIGDTNNDGILDLTETWLYTATGTAEAGEYANIATVSGDWAFGQGSGTVTGIEEDCYVGATPSIAIVKQTNGTDDVCPVILAGETVTWTYAVTNTGDIALGNVVVTDDNGTPLDDTDDFNPDAVLGADLVHNIGDVDNDGLLDLTETWQYTASGTALAGEYENVATVTGDATDDFQNTTTVNGSEGDCYFGATPSIDIVKLTNGFNDLCPVVTVGSTVTWTYNVTNTGDIALGNIVVEDDNGTDGDTTDDFNPDAVLGADLVHNIGDIDNDGLLDLTETWQYTASGTALEGHYENVATVTGDATDDFQNTTSVNASEEDCYIAVEGPGVRTPGFWSNWTDFWDGDASVPKQAGQDCFPIADLLYAVDSTGDGVVDATKGLLIGDYDRDGNNRGADGIAGTADDEDVIFISLADALNLINASNKQMNDGVVKIGRDSVASWLNYLAGNPIGTVDGTDGQYSPREAIDDAVDYLQIFGDSNNAVPGGNQNNPAEIFDVYSSNHRVVRTSSDFWSQDFPGGGHSGSEIHGALDEYNNFGSVDGFGFAHDCDGVQLLSTLSGFSVNGELFVH